MTKNPTGMKRLNVFASVVMILETIGSTFSRLQESPLRQTDVHNARARSSQLATRTGHVSARRSFEVIVLKDYGNYHTLKKYLVFSPTMPQPGDLKLKEKDEIMDIKELRDVEVVIK